jgi:hypothetical protein
MTSSIIKIRNSIAAWLLTGKWMRQPGCVVFSDYSTVSTKINDTGDIEVTFNSIWYSNLAVIQGKKHCSFAKRKPNQAHYTFELETNS